MNINEQQQSAIRALNHNPSFLIYIELLEQEYTTAIKSLLVASGDQLLRQQSKASTLRRLIDDLKSIF